MNEKRYNNFVEQFEKNGDPHYEDSLLESFYDAYKIGLLKEYVYSIFKDVRIKAEYNGNIDELIDTIRHDEEYDKKESIYIPGEIRNINHLIKLKETFPDKVIVSHFGNELAFIDDIIDSQYMIDYYTQLIPEDFSPLEKITMVYDIVKSFEYKKEDNRTLESRQITKMVHNDKIVCVGFATLFNMTLRELGIKYAANLSTTERNEKSGLEIGHARSIVYFNDDKYNIIPAFYVFDPTYDASNNVKFYKSDDSTIKISKESKEGYTKADSMSLYDYFLVPSFCYENKFRSSKDEEIRFVRLNVDADIKELLHGNQVEGIQVLSDEKFVELLYNVKLAEGYSREDIPQLIQEISICSSDRKIYSIDFIEQIISEIEQEKVLKAS